MTTSHLTYHGEIQGACGQSLNGVDHTGVYDKVLVAIAKGGGDACQDCLHLLETP